MSNLFTLIFLVLSVTQVYSQDDWFSYITEKDKEFMAVTTNLRYDNAKPNYKNLLIVGKTTQKCHKNGYPTELGLEELFTFSDTTAQVLNRTVKKNRLVGVLTYQCNGFDVFYIKDTVGVRAALEKVYGNYFNNEKYYIFLKQDKRWQYYKDILFPKRFTDDFFINQELLTALFYDGYNLNDEYNLIHWFYFKKEKYRKKFLEKLKVINVTVHSLKTIEGKNHPYELQLVRKDQLQPAFIDELTRTFGIFAESYGGFYDGWGIKLNYSYGYT
ncbi:MAG: hypothetical protein CR989_04255 [Flavobacteriales bacterium]|nr:MAG: hypothetical protein CR989_04255 [Flavobacteriales bacterium]